MPLIQGVDIHGRPVYSNPVGGVPTKKGGPTADKLQQAVDEVDPGPKQYESNINYNIINDRFGTINSQGANATARAQDAARAAIQARLLKTQTAANNSIAKAATQYGSGQTPAGNTSSTGNTGTDLRSRLVAKVASQKGVDYQWGGESPKTGFDCSGLIQWAYGKLGIEMPRVSGQQARMGKRTSIKNLQLGDLVAHPGHIAVYAGNGMMWESPHTGAQVRLVRVRSDMYGIHLTLEGD